MWLKLNGRFGATTATNPAPAFPLLKPDTEPEIKWLPILIDTDNVLHFVQNDVGTHVVYKDDLAPNPSPMFPLTLKETVDQIFMAMAHGRG